MKQNIFISMVLMAMISFCFREIQPVLSAFVFLEERGMTASSTLLIQRKQNTLQAFMIMLQEKIQSSKENIPGLYFLMTGTLLNSTGSRCTMIPIFHCLSCTTHRK